MPPRWEKVDTGRSVGEVQPQGGHSSFDRLECVASQPVPASWVGDRGGRGEAQCLPSQRRQAEASSSPLGGRSSASARSATIRTE